MRVEMTQPTVDIDELLHGGMRAIASYHDLDMEGAYVLAAKLMVNIEPELDEYNPNGDPILDEMLINAARTAHERGLLEDEDWVTNE